MSKGEFASAIKGNEALLREWSTSANQNMMIVKVAAQAMGADIAQAIVYK